MQCENGYTKPGVKGILCRKAETPTDGNLKSVAHALCGHQLSVVDNNTWAPDVYGWSVI